MNSTPTGRAPRFRARRAAPIAVAVLVGCGSGTTIEAPATDAPAASAKERIAKNPRLKAEGEALEKKSMSKSKPTVKIR